MKPLKLLPLSLALLLALPGAASADRGRGYDNGRSYDHSSYRGGYNDHHHQESRRKNSWGNAATAAIILGAIGVAAYANSAPPAPVVVMPPPQPVYVQPQARGYWYYCGSARQYYPYVNYCPEGWLPVAPQ